MTEVKLSGHGFRVKGHCTVDANDELGRLVCASVSSAVYLTANTITDVIRDKAEISEKDGLLEIKVLSPSRETEIVLNGFKLHMLQLSEQYPNCIKVNLEV